MKDKALNRLAMNSSSALLYQFVATVCGFILPRCILSAYGSSVNGLLASISQFLSFISFMEFGVGAVVQSALYRPLVTKDDAQVSRIVKSASSFFRKLALIFLIYVIALIVIYPSSQRDTYDYFFTASLIAIISISYFSEYYFGIVNQLLIGADQKGYIYLLLQTGAVVFNTIVCIIIIRMGASVQLVKLVTSIVYSIRPIVLHFYVKKSYHIDTKVKYEGEPIKQKWNGLAQHLASVVLSSTDVVVLTMFSSLENVSIYSVYALITNGVKQLVASFTSGMMSYFGKLIAKNEIGELNHRFDYLEWFIHFIITILFGCTSVLILPFVQVYTTGVNDANYYTPVFAYILTLAAASHSLRVPYNTIVMAAGHFKETQISAIIETVLNITISIALVKILGLIGVAVGTLISMSYRTIYLVFYLQKHIVQRRIAIFIKHILVDALIAFLISCASNMFYLHSITYYAWIILSIQIFLAALCIAIVVNVIFYRTFFICLMNKINMRIRR